MLRDGWSHQKTNFLKSAKGGWGERGHESDKKNCYMIFWKWGCLQLFWKFICFRDATSPKPLIHLIGFGRRVLHTLWRQRCRKRVPWEWHSRVRPQQTIKDNWSLQLINIFKRYDDGSYVTGTWNHGIRHGPFTFDTNKQESEVRNIFNHYWIIVKNCAGVIFWGRVQGRLPGRLGTDPLEGRHLVRGILQGRRSSRLCQALWR